MKQKTQAVQTRDEALLAQSKFLTDVSRRVAEQEKDPGAGALLALEALRDESSDDPITSGRPYWKPAELALLSARLLSHEQGLLKGHGAAVKSVAMSPDGTRIVSGSDDATARIWDARTRRRAFESQGPRRQRPERGGNAGRYPHRHRLG
jgi:hypothetical protein